MEREIKAVENEFQGVFTSDGSRIWQLLGENTKEKSHPINCFSWGNLKSLLNGQDLESGSESLWQDLAQFFNQSYSAERMTLVIQATTDDNMKQVKEWCIKYFGLIQSKPNLTRQFFNIKQKKTNDKTNQDDKENSIDSLLHSLPFDTSEIIIMNGIQDEFKLTVVYQF